MKNYIHTLLRIVFSVYALAFSSGCDVRYRILMVGDSNMQATADAYTGWLYGGAGQSGWHSPAPSYLLTFAAVPGSGFKDSDNWVPSLESIDAAGSWDAVVLNLGVNDAQAGMCTPASELAARIDAVYGALPEDIPIIVLDAVYPVNTGYSFSCAVDVNLALQAAHYRWAPRTHYVNTNNVLNGLPANLRFDASGVHFHQHAKYAIAEAVRIAIEAAL